MTDKNPSGGEMNKNKYDLMGEYVVVKAYMKPRKKGCARSHYLIKLKEPRVGMVVGYRTVYEGKIREGGYDDGYYQDNYEPSCFVVEKSIKVLLVCFWPTYNPVLVMPEDANSNIMTAREVTVNLRPTFHKWTERDRKVQREIMKSVPRNAKGKWM